MRVFFRSRVIALFSALVLVQASAFSGEVGNPAVKSIESLAFTPKGMLLIGDGVGAQVVAVNTGDAASSVAPKFDIADIRAEIAGRLGTMADGIEIQRLAVNPVSKKAYLVVLRLQGKQSLIVTVDASNKIAEFSLDKVDFRRYLLPSEGKVSVTKITDLTWAGDRILVAVTANDTFASRIYSILPESASNIQPVSFSTETYHVAHRKWETKAPLRTIMPYEENGKNYLVGAFTCTPIVKYSLDDLKAGDHVKGESIVELGQGNTPIDMFSYEKAGKKYILMNTFRFQHKQNPVGPSPYWAAKVDYDMLKEKLNINEKAVWRTTGKASESNITQAQVASDYFGVTLMDRLNTDNALVVRNEADKQALRILPLP